MRILVTGATGNVGSAVVRALAGAPEVEEVIGLARRDGGRPPSPNVSWRTGDVRDRDAVVAAVRGMDAVVHLAWAIQPSRDRRHTRAVNVDGSQHVFDAAARAGVATLVHASSVGVYSPAPDAAPRDEDWGRSGIATSFYSRDKAEVEQRLDETEALNPAMRVVRLRPSLIFQRGAAAEIRRLFAGPLLPGALLRPALIPLLPHVGALRFQAVHADDVADAYRRAVLDERARGAYNVAAEPVLTTATVAGIFDARTVPVPFGVARAAAGLAWRAHLTPTPPWWLDLAAFGPVLDTSRIRRELGWRPSHDGEAALRELLEGLRDGAGGPTPPLHPGAGGPARVREILTGVGARS